jgi:hypothetical protein
MNLENIARPTRRLPVHMRTISATIKIGSSSELAIPILPDPLDKNSRTLNWSQLSKSDSPVPLEAKITFDSSSDLASPMLPHPLRI